MRALTIKQPYAAWILAGSKTSEYRSWTTAYRGTLALHAGTATDCLHLAGVDVGEDAAQRYPRGAIVGMIDIVGVDFDPARQCYAWKLANVVALPEPIACKGACKFWFVPDDVQTAIRKAMSSVVVK